MTLPEADGGLNGTGVFQTAGMAACGAIGVALNQAQALEVLQHSGNDLRRSSKARGQGLRLEGATVSNLIQKSLQHMCQSPKARAR